MFKLVTWIPVLLAGSNLAIAQEDPPFTIVAADANSWAASGGIQAVDFWDSPPAPNVPMPDNDALLAVSQAPWVASQSLECLDCSCDVPLDAILNADASGTTAGAESTRAFVPVVFVTCNNTQQVSYDCSDFSPSTFGAWIANANSTLRIDNFVEVFDAQFAVSTVNVYLGVNGGGNRVFPNGATVTAMAGRLIATATYNQIDNSWQITTAVPQVVFTEFNDEGDPVAAQTIVESEQFTVDGENLNLWLQGEQTDFYVPFGAPGEQLGQLTAAVNFGAGIVTTTADGYGSSLSGAVAAAWVSVEGIRQADP